MSAHGLRRHTDKVCNRQSLSARRRESLLEDSRRTPVNKETVFIVHLQMRENDFRTCVRWQMLSEKLPSFFSLVSAPDRNLIICPGVRSQASSERV